MAMAMAPVPVPASELDITPTEPDRGAHFQARPRAEWRADLVGTFRSAAPFDHL